MSVGLVHVLAASNIGVNRGGLIQEQRLRVLLISIFAAILTTFALRGLASWLAGSKPPQITATEGVIEPDRISAWITIVIGVLMFFGSPYLVAYSNVGLIGVVTAGLGLAIAAFMSPSLTSMHAVYWNSVGMEGPAKTFGPGLGRARTQIKWEDITTGGSTRTGFWYVQSDGGRGIYWSYLYKGHGHLGAAL